MVRPTLCLLLAAAARGLQPGASLLRPAALRRTSLPFAQGEPVVAAAPTDAAARLLDLIGPTDRGIAASDELRAEISSLIEGLEESWQGTDAFAEPARTQLLRRCEVAYVGQSSSKKANAAGGKYRGRIGRMLFRTEALFQHVLEPDVAVNVIQFKLFGLLPGAAVLPGRWRRAEGDTELRRLQRNSTRALSANTVAVEFESPRVCFGREGRFASFQLGPSSTVGLDTTYLDDTLRICRGAGSAVPFVFRADTVADGAALGAASQQWERCVARRPLRKIGLVATLTLGAIASFQRWLPVPLPRLAAALLAAAALATLRSTGGIVVDRDGSRPTGEPQQA